MILFTDKVLLGLMAASLGLMFLLGLFTGYAIRPKAKRNRKGQFVSR